MIVGVIVDVVGADINVESVLAPFAVAVVEEVDFAAAAAAVVFLVLVLLVVVVAVVGMPPYYHQYLVLADGLVAEE